MFSDDGHWVTAWASGAAVVSTFPVDINASRSPELRTCPSTGCHQALALPGREALDPDDYCGGFAVWSGTSFSAPLLAAHIARVAAEGRRPHPAWAGRSRGRRRRRTGRWPP